MLIEYEVSWRKPEYWPHAQQEPLKVTCAGPVEAATAFYAPFGGFYKCRGVCVIIKDDSGAESIWAPVFLADKWQVVPINESGDPIGLSEILSFTELRIQEEILKHNQRRG